VARSGQFQGPSDLYGEPLSFIYPRDGLKGFEKARYSPGLLKVKNLTDAERDRLQAEIDELIATAKLSEQLP
jgi:hypothetical protein